MRGRRVRPATHPQERRSPEVRRVSLADRRRIRGGNTPAGPQEARNRDAAHPTIRSVLARPRYASRRHSIAEVAVSRSWQLSWWISRCRTSLRKDGKQVVYTCLEFRERPRFTESIRVWIQSSPLRGGGVFVAAGLRLPGIYRAGRPTSPIAGGFSICILWVGCGPSFRPPGCLYSVVAILSSREGMWLITGSSHICQDRFSVPTHLSATMRIGWQTYPSSRIGLSLRSSAA